MPRPFIAASLHLLAILGAAAFAHVQAHANAFPAKPIRVVVTISAGGGPDVVLRMLSPYVQEKLGQPFVVDNRPGGGTVLATDLVANATPDGYTLLNSTDTLLLVGAMKRVKFDVRKAFAPVIQLTTQWYLFVVNPALPMKSVKDLIAHARARPEAMNYASQGTGTTGHLGMERFKAATGIHMEHLPYKGAAPALVDIMGGQIQTMFASTVSAAPHVSSGRLRALAITAPKRSAFLPDVPTVAEAGGPEFRLSNTYSLVAPGATPASVVQRLHEGIHAALRTPAVVKRLAADGSEPAPYLTPSEFRAFIAREYLIVEKQVQGLKLRD
jgi:tripartite-type tricarboxylate transporter receptor subunit TctC